MKTISVEQWDGTSQLILSAVVLLAMLGLGIYVVTRMTKNKHAIVAGSLTGIITATVVFGITIAGNTFIDQRNLDYVTEAAAELGHEISEEESLELKNNGALVLDDKKTLVFSDEGNAFTMTTYDDEENAKAQAEEDKKREQEVADNDY